MKKTVILFLFSLLLTFVVSCTPSHYRLSFEEIDDMADYYPAQAKVYLERTDSNDNKGYYKLLACKIRYQITGVCFLRRDSDIEDAIQIFTKENNEPMLARALYYKGAMTFNTTHDTTQTLQILMQACRHSSIMRQKEKLDLYDLMCRITHDNSYTVKLEDEARQSHNISHRAWATLYRAVNNQDRQLAEEAFDIAYSIPENKDSTLGPMYNYYFQKLIEQGNTPDSVIMDYINLADQLKDVENATLAERCEQLNHDITTQVRKLKRRDKDIELYKTQIGELTDISQGLIYYSQAVQNKNISQIGKQGILQLLASYRMIDEKYSKRLACYDLNPSHCLFCILYHMGKTDEEVMQIMQYSMANIRVRKSRIKADCEVYSFEAVISREV